MIVPLMFFAALAAHPHTSCDEAVVKQCKLQFYNREPIAIVAEERTFAHAVRAHLVDGWGASQYAFYVERNGQRIPISRAQAAKLAGEKQMAKSWARTNRFRSTPDGSQNGALSERLWAEKLGLDDDTAMWLLLSRDVALTVVAPYRVAASVQNTIAIAALAPSDDALLASPRVLVRRTPPQ